MSSINENILNIQTTFKKNENEKIIEINNLKYKKYYVFSPSVNSFWNIDNISEELNNNKIEASFINFDDVTQMETGFFNRALKLDYNYGQKNLPIVYDNFGRKNIRILPDSEISPSNRVASFSTNEGNVINAASNVKIEIETYLVEPGLIIPNIFYLNDDFGKINYSAPYRFRGSVCFTPMMANNTDRFLTFKTTTLSRKRIIGMIVYEYDNYGIAVKNRVALTLNAFTGTFVDANTFNYTNLNNNYFNSLLSAFGQSYAIFPRLNYRFLLIFDHTNPFPAMYNNFLFLNDLFDIGLSPYKLNDNLFNLIQNKYYLTTREFGYRSFTVNSAYFSLSDAPFGRTATLMNLLLPSFSSNQPLIETEIQIQNTTQTVGVSRCSYLFDLKTPNGASIWTYGPSNGSQKTFDNFNLLTRASTNGTFTEEEFLDNYNAGTMKIFQWNGTALTLRTAFNFPINGSNCLITTPFIPTSELRMLKTLEATDMKITLYQIKTIDGTYNMFNSMKNLKNETFKLSTISTRKFNGTDYSSIYLKFPENILSIFNCAKLIRLVNEADITNQIGPIFLSSTEMIYYGLVVDKSYKLEFQYSDEGKGEAVKDLDIILISYSGTQNLEVITKTELSLTNWTIIPYVTTTFCIVQFENFTRTNNNIDGLLLTAIPENFATSNEIIFTNDITEFNVSYYREFYTNDQLKLVRYAMGGTRLYEIDYNYYTLNTLESNKYTYYFKIPTEANSTKIKISNLDYSKELVGRFVFYQTSNRINKSITIPNGWYSGIDGVNYLVEQMKTLTGLTDITFNQFTNKLTFVNPTSDIIRLIFTKPTSSFQESSSTLYGFNLPSVVLNKLSQTISPLEMDLYFNGRFSQIKINLLNFSNFGFINESLTLIKLIAKDKKGTLSQNQVVNFIKMLPPNIVLSNLSFQIVDNRNLLVKFNEAIDVEFLIRCVNES